MYYDDHPVACFFGSVLEICALGGMYYWGNQNGKKEIINQISESRRDEEIRNLKEEIERLKKR